MENESYATTHGAFLRAETLRLMYPAVLLEVTLWDMEKRVGEQDMSGGESR